MSESMKAIRVERLGPPDVMELQDVPAPTPGPGEVRIEVEAVGINFADVLSVAGEYLTRTRVPYTPGMEFAGIVESLGEGVTGVQVGQRVAALGGSGALARYSVVNAAGLIPVPENLSGAQAAAFPVSYFTAYHGLKTLGRGVEGEWVLVQAAAGALGTASIQLAKAMGMHVIALASTDEKLALARDLGADVTILQDDPDRVQKVRDAAGGKGVPLILEVVGGKRFQESLDMAAPQGRIIVIGNASREQANLRPVELMKRNLTVTGLWLTSLMNDRAATMQAAQALAGLVGSGKVTPQVGPTYALADSARAFQDLLDRKTTGKVIIEPAR
ncbi:MULTISPECIES: NADPH:quinone oxidoreductase family protein [unclassified Deinococcus]|uniref:NADPH:quinone oxidoreductase family protein n=1 Tax=unclassified Deinococcus TaxID=2623546 RepID=UPI001E568A40|nr:MULTISPECIES: NADPH:quinone oxidoreductase family protein [unclassified Deinococcus]MCD0161574.1 NADPH:quinone oxidoreductase family protein [Deinococcus sp. 6YEL10]MCD0165474.1 NADPH:quinone oxidoreductase family protein [Deinococcus sp. 12RED42]MCD0169284.1 NADPH:quinone oxidoreductase family protein [Deinococcus sp. 23YEL01]